MERKKKRRNGNEERGFEKLTILMRLKKQIPKQKDVIRICSIL